MASSLKRALTLAAGITTLAGLMTVATAGSLAGVAGAASTSPGTAGASAGTSYRHGLVPTVGSQASSTPTAHIRTASSINNLAFGGGLNGVGVTTGAPKLYLVFYGSQWGTQGTTTRNGQTYASFSGDPKGMAPDLQAFFTGVGTGTGSSQDLWSGVMTQYCEGVATGATTCPSTAAHVGYPTGGALTGVWEDTSVSSPSAASATQLAQEAQKAATHFGNNTQGLNRDSQYFIVSPPGANPDNYRTGGFCAWHDDTADGSAISQTNGIVAFTNLPYLTDVGASCGQDFVNSGTAGTLDGVTIVGGHEYAETITDQFPAGGWTVPASGSLAGYENGDLCAWITSGQGASSNLTLTTGTFAVQSTWANDFNGGSGGCELSHPIVTNASTNTVTVTQPNPQSSTVGTAASLQIQATDSATSQTLTYSAVGLPGGLSINASSGLISGTPNTAVLNSSVTVTATDGTGASGSASFTWTVNNPTPPGNSVTVTNPGSQTSSVGTAIAPLVIKASDTQLNQTFTYAATGLPTGLSINNTTGVITGTPSAAGSFGPVVTVTDTTGANGSASFSWTVTIAPNTVTVRNPGNQSSRTNRSVSLSVSGTDSGAGQTLTFSAVNLPPGLSISSTGSLTAVISGRPSRSGTYSVTLTATDTTGAHGSTKFSWTVRSFGSSTAPSGSGSHQNSGGTSGTTSTNSSWLERWLW